MPRREDVTYEGGTVYQRTVQFTDTAAIDRLFALAKLMYDDIAAGGGGGVPTGRTISTTAPLSGGGDLSANRTFSLDASAASILFGRGDSGAGVAEEIALGSGLTMTGTTLSASGGGGGAGVGEVDFGAWPGTTDTTLAITGQGSIVAGSVVSAWLYPKATTEHSLDEHVVEEIDIYAGNIVAATGFTIYAKTRSLRLYGKYSVAWRWI